MAPATNLHQRRLELAIDAPLPATFPPLLHALVIADHGLLRIPTAALELRQLTALHLPRNMIRSVPDELGAAMPALRVAVLAHNDLHHFPRGLCLPLMERIDVSHNHIAAVPEQLADAHALESVNVAHNQLRCATVRPA